MQHVLICATAFLESIIAMRDKENLLACIHFQKTFYRFQIGDQQPQPRGKITGLKTLY